MGVARSKRVVVLDPFTGRSASILTRNDHTTLDNTRFVVALQLIHLRLWTCRSYTLANFGKDGMALDPNDELASLIPEKIDYSTPLEELSMLISQSACSG